MHVDAKGLPRVVVEIDRRLQHRSQTQPPYRVFSLIVNRSARMYL